MHIIITYASLYIIVHNHTHAWKYVAGYADTTCLEPRWPLFLLGDLLIRKDFPRIWCSLLSTCSDELANMRLLTKALLLWSVQDSSGESNGLAMWNIKNHVDIEGSQAWGLSSAMFSSMLSTSSNINSSSNRYQMSYHIKVNWWSQNKHVS